MTKTGTLSICLVLSIFSSFAQTITTFAGGGVGDGNNPKASYLLPFRVLLHDSNLYVGEPLVGAIRRITLDGQVTTIAGNRKQINSNQIITGGPATATSLGYPCGVAFDSKNKLYFLDAGANSVLMIDDAGALKRIAGVDTFGYWGDGGPATAAAFNGPVGFAIDKHDNIFIADSRNGVVRKVSAGIVTTVAGGGTVAVHYPGSVPAMSAQLSYINDVVVDNNDNLYILTGANLYKVDNAGTMAEIVSSADTSVHLGGAALTLNKAGDIYALTMDKVYKLTAGGASVLSGHNALSAVGMTVGADGKIFISSGPSNGPGNILLLNNDGTTDTFAGNTDYTCDGTDAPDAMVPYPLAVAGSPKGDVFIAHKNIGSQPFKIRQIGRNGVISTMLKLPAADVCVDKHNNLYALSFGRGVVYKILPNGDTLRYAGTYTSGSVEDNIPATAATLLSQSNSIAMDDAGNLFVNERYRIRKVNSAGIIATIAGDGVVGTPDGDGIPATAAKVLCNSLAADNAGNLYLLEPNDIKKITPDGMIHKIAGCSGCTEEGNGVPSIAAYIRTGRNNDIVTDTAGNIYFSDIYNVRKIDASGIVTKVAGNDTLGFSGDGGNASSAAFSYPYGLSIDDSGRLYVADFGNCRIRRINTMYRFPTVQTPKIDSSGAVKLFPNPASAYLDVSWYSASGSGSSWSVSDATGRTVMTGEAEPVNGIVNEHILLPQLLPPGMYMFRRGSEKALRFVLTR